MKPFGRIMFPFGLFVLCGCSPKGFNVYEVPHESIKEFVLPEAPAETPAELSWTTPARWKEKLKTPMRLASYEIRTLQGTLDFSIIRLEGDGGGDLANVNRWRAQEGLDVWSAEVFAQNVQIVPHPRLAIRTIWIEGAKNAILGAMTNNGGYTWFFKMCGPIEAAKIERGDFVKLLEGLRIR
jgi:hypothetical protein